MLGRLIQQRFSRYGGVELDLHARSELPRAAEFDDLETDDTDLPDPSQS
jgi:hypothetical protein